MPATKAYHRCKAATFSTLYSITSPRRAWCLRCCPVPRRSWTAVFGFADLRRLPEADFVVDRRAFGAYGHDWRAVPLLNWLANMAGQQLDFRVETAVAATTPAEPHIMNESDFTSAVHDALRNFANEVVYKTTRC